VTRLSSHGPRARAEFRRLLLESQIGRGEAELAARRSRNQRLRVRRIERRLVALRTLLGELDGAERSAARSWLHSRTAGALLSVAWVAGAVALAVEIARHGVHSAVVTVGVVAMLALSLLWFALAVARVPLRQDADRDTGPARPERHA
jgi:hypothetical protein